MRNAARDLLRLSLTAAAIAGFVLYAGSTASSAIPPQKGAAARTDSIRYAMEMAVDTVAAPPGVAQRSHAARPASPIDAPSFKDRAQVALAR